MSPADSAEPGPRVPPASTGAAPGAPDPAADAAVGDLQARPAIDVSATENSSRGPAADHGDETVGQPSGDRSAGFAGPTHGARLVAGGPDSVTDDADRNGPSPFFASVLRAGPIRTHRGHRWGLGAFLLVELVFLVTSVLVAVPFAKARSNPAELPIALLVSLAVPTIIAAAVAVLITVLRGGGPVADLGLRWRWADFTRGLGIGVVGLVITTAASELWAKWVGAGNANSAVGSLMDGVRFPPILAIVLFLHLWLLAPICEEIIYRGLLWGALERWRLTRWVCLAASTAIFAIAHLEPLRTPLLLIIGIPIGLARLVTGRLPASIVVHSMNNLLPALGILLMSQGVLRP